MRPCLECGADIAHLHGLAKRCPGCRNAPHTRRTLAYRKTPEGAAKRRIYDRAQYNLKFAKGVLTCADCGAGACRSERKPGNLYGITLCTYCFNQRQKIWTREAAIEAIKEFVGIYGRTPTAQDWNVAMARNNGRDDLVQRWQDDACWPTTGTIQVLFGKWSEGIKAAGLEPRKIGGRGPESEYSRSKRVTAA